VSIGANFMAAIVSFFCLVIGPWACVETLASLIDLGEVGDWMIQVLPTGLNETFRVAAGGSLLFLVVGWILQVWQHHRPFATGWPIVLAFPVTWALLLPETLVRGGPVLAWILMGGGIAVAFSIHWLALVTVREVMD
jgi:hypothetical protein